MLDIAGQDAFWSFNLIVHVKSGAAELKLGISFKTLNYSLNGGSGFYLSCWQLLPVQHRLVKCVVVYQFSFGEELVRLCIRLCVLSNTFDMQKAGMPKKGLHAAKYQA